MQRDFHRVLSVFDFTNVTVYLWMQLDYCQRFRCSTARHSATDTIPFGWKSIFAFKTAFFCFTFLPDTEQAVTGAYKGPGVLEKRDGYLLDIAVHRGLYCTLTHQSTRDTGKHLRSAELRYPNTEHRIVSFFFFFERCILHYAMHRLCIYIGIKYINFKTVFDVEMHAALNVPNSITMDSSKNL